MTPPSETPRTDALLLIVNEGRVYDTDGPVADLCRKLEREVITLTRERDEARERAIEECAKVADSGMLVPPDGGSPTPWEISVVQSVAQAIRALKTAGKPYDRMDLPRYSRMTKKDAE